ncbi:YvcK family protein [Fervidobacterium riparium]|nr:hypothetical protein IB67_07050 [Fervidobacterium riparium]
MKIVTVGGGTGLSTLLRGLKNFDCNLTAVVTITDEGGSSGILREELNVPPPGDIRNNLVALASSENILSAVLNYRFENGSLAGHTVGNILLAALTKMTGSFTEAISKVSDILAIKGKVLPVSLKMARLLAVFEDGQEICGETNIVEYCKSSGKKIRKLTLEDPVEINPEVEHAIVESDAIIFGPGSLYTSIIANFVVDGFSNAVKKSKALKIYVSNIMTQPGETEGYTLKDHVYEIERYLGTNLDYIIHSLPPESNVLERYAQKSSYPVKIDIDDTRLVVGHFSRVLYETEHRIRHDSFAVANAIFNLLTAKIENIDKVQSEVTM